MNNCVGIDAQPISEIAASLGQFGSRYTARLFTSREIDDCGVNSDSATWRYAERFAAKEAVLKILDVREIVPSWKEIEIRSARGRHEVVLHGVAAQLAGERGIRDISVSTSHDALVAFAVAVARDVKPR